MDLNIIFQSFVTACIPALVAYITASKQSKTKMDELDRNTRLELEKLERTHKAELEKMQVEYDLKTKEQELHSQNDFVDKLLSGGLDLGGALAGIDQLSELADKATKLQNSNLVKNSKR